MLGVSDDRAIPNPQREGCRRDRRGKLATAELRRGDVAAEGCARIGSGRHRFCRATCSRSRRVIIGSGTFTAKVITPLTWRSTRLPVFSGLGSSHTLIGLSGSMPVSGLLSGLRASVSSVLSRYTCAGAYPTHRWVVGRCVAYNQQAGHSATLRSAPWQIPSPPDNFSVALPKHHPSRRQCFLLNSPRHGFCPVAKPPQEHGDARPGRKHASRGGYQWPRRKRSHSSLAPIGASA